MEYRPDKISEELKSICPTLVNIARVNVFAAPPFYFDQLADNILSLVKAEALSFTAVLERKNPYTIPTGYFEGLTRQILNKVTGDTEVNFVSDELETIAPLLNSIDKRMVYSVPEHYFETFAITRNAEAPVAKMSAATTIKSMYRYAAAAVVIGILVFGAIFFTRQNNADGGANTTAIANIKEELKKVSDTEIATYLDSNNFAVEVSATNIYLNEELPVHEYIKSISEEEIRLYLKENGPLKKDI